MSRLVILVFVCVLNVNSVAQCRAGQDSLGDHYPYDTRCLFAISNTAEFVRAAAGCESVQSLLKSPIPVLGKLLADRAENDPVFEGAVGIGEDDSEMIQRLSGLFDGGLEVAVVEHQGALAIVAKAEINSSDPLVKAMQTLLSDENNFQYFDVESIDLVAGRTGLIHKPSGVCFEFIEGKLSLYSIRSLVATVEKWNSEKSERRLSDSRKFQLLEQRCQFSDHRDNGALVYIDINAILADVLKQSVNPKQSDSLAREISINELLAIGAVFQWGKNTSESVVDFELKIHVAQGIPRTGINNILRLQALEQPAAADIPAGVDTCFSANMDVESVVKGIRALNTILEANFKSKDLATRAILNTLPLLGAFCYTIDEQDAKGCQGLLEHFGRFRDTATVRAFTDVTRLSGIPKNANELMDAVIAAELAAGSLVKTELFGIACATWSESFEIFQRQQNERLEKQFPDLVLPKTGRQIFFAHDDQIGLAGDEQLFEQVVTKSAENLLIDDDNFQSCWEYVSKDEVPGAFLYLSPGTLFRPIVYLNQAIINPTYHDSRLKISEEQQLEKDSWENSYHRGAMEAGRGWNYSSLAQELGPSAFSFSETPNGFDIRIVQFRKSKK